MKRGVAALLVVTLLAPIPAHAEEREESEVETVASEVASAPPVMLYSPDLLARSPMPLVAPSSKLELDPKMTPIRLTHGEKVAIIVAACVVGALILIFAVGRPHKHW